MDAKFWMGIRRRQPRRRNNKSWENRRMSMIVIANSVIMTNIAITRKVATAKNVVIMRKVGFTTAMVGEQENK